MRSQFHRIIPMLLLAAACGGDGGGETPPGVVTIIKWTPSGDNQSDTSGQTLPLVLRVKVTVDGEVSGGHEVVWAGPGTFGSPTSVTASNGVATTTWTLPTEAGVTHATATLAGAAGSPLTFTATGLVGAATGMIKVSGDNQATTPGDIFNNAFSVQIVDEFGNGKAGVMVHWSVNGPADLLADSAPTDEVGTGNGYLTAQNALGPLTMTATVTGLTGSPQVFNATVIGKTSTVLVKDFVFEPQNLAIKPGESVKWQIVGNGHTVTSTGGGVIQNSGVMNAGAVWGPFTFASPGVYTYECSEHVGMTGTITVNP